MSSSSRPRTAPAAMPGGCRRPCPGSSRCRAAGSLRWAGWRRAAGCSRHAAPSGGGPTPRPRPRSAGGRRGAAAWSRRSLQRECPLRAAVSTLRTPASSGARPTGAESTSGESGAGPGATTAPFGMQRSALITTGSASTGLDRWPTRTPVRRRPVGTAARRRPRPARSRRTGADGPVLPSHVVGHGGNGVGARRHRGQIDDRQLGQMGQAPTTTPGRARFRPMSRRPSDWPVAWPRRPAGPDRLR